MIEFKGCYYCECCLKEYPEGAGECPDCKGISSKPIADALPAGTVLAGRYLIGNPLGRGAFGITYLAMEEKAPPLELTQRSILCHPA